MTKKKTSFIRKRFKDQETSLLMLMQSDPEFFELCEDYEICMKATDYWSGKGVTGGQDKAKEFRDIASDIEAEIGKILEGHKP